jgi:hypothetical protein
MRRAAIIFAAMLGVVPLCLGAQGRSTKSAAARSVQQTLFGLENEWTRALVRGDTAAFRRLTVPGFVYTEDNVVMTQDELVHAIATSTDRIESAGNEEMKLYDYSPVAVVTGILVIKGRNKGGPFTNRYRFTDTWLYRNGKWRAIAAQDYLIPK